MTRRRALWAAVGLAVVSMLLIASTSEAHQPIYKYASEDISTFAHAKVVDSAEISYAYYAELLPGGADIYEIYTRPGQVANPCLLVPMQDRLKDFTPTMAIVGPGITSTSTLAGLPDSLDGSVRGLVLDYKHDLSNRPVEFEPFTQTSYWKDQEYRGTYPGYGPYFVLVWDKMNRGGRYVLTLGQEEQVSPADVLKFPYRWVKLHIWFSDWTALGVATLVVMVVVYALVRLVLRRRQA